MQTGVGRWDFSQPTFDPYRSLSKGCAAILYVLTGQEQHIPFMLHLSLFLAIPLCLLFLTGGVKNKYKRRKEGNRQENTSRWAGRGNIELGMAAIESICCCSRSLSRSYIYG
jgi:hypothetical protein